MRICMEETAMLDIFNNDAFGVIQLERARDEAASQRMDVPAMAKIAFTSEDRFGK